MLSSLKKICGILKKHCLEDGDSVPMTRRNNTYDAMVLYAMLQEIPY
jgi:hypothetical protein